MAVSFRDMKQGRQTALNSITKKLDELKQGNFPRDERYWQPVVDPKTKTGSAILRFLPPAEGEDIPFVRKYSHAFKDPKTGLWYIEGCRTTINEKDPCAEYNSILWGPGKDCIPENKDQVSRQKRKLGFLANVLVVKHSARPEDEGKVFIFDFGKQVFDKLNDKMNPPTEDDERMNPFDFWTGANFRLRIAPNDAGFRNYTKSEFDAPSPLSEDDAELERVWKMQYPLQAEVAPDKFKSYEELEKKLLKVLGKTHADWREGSEAPRASSRSEAPSWESAAPSFARTRETPVAEDAPVDVTASEESEELEFFRAIAKKK